MKALLLANEAGKKVVGQVRHYLQHNGWEVDSYHLNADLTNATADFVVVCGGDGSILGVGRRMGMNQIPIVGVNSGKLGYLASFSVADFGKFCENKGREYYISKRVMLNVYSPHTGSESHFLAVNDLVIDIGPPFRTIEIGIRIGNSMSMPKFRGDGIIISTPTGSTAYNLSAGGPIIHPELDAFVLTPKNPHLLSIRPLVAHSDDEIVISVNQPPDGGAFAIIDGQHHVELPKKCHLRINKAEQKIGIVQNVDSWKTLTQKLHWGE